jgi:catechol 2,3-dioxygenase-like lactoylglutathione lyase family enzyme
MDFASIRVITDDVARLVAFYEQVTGTPAQWGSDQFAQLVTPVGTVAIASTRTMELFGASAAHAADNRSVLVEFRVDDVDAEAARLRGLGVELVLEPTTQPWGNRSVLFRDPDGNLVNLFAPVLSPEPAPSRRP